MTRIKLSFTDWLFLLKAIESTQKNYQAVVSFKIAQEKLKNQPNFQFLLETEHQN